MSDKLLSDRLRKLRNSVGKWGLGVATQEEMYKTIDYLTAMAEGQEERLREAELLLGTAHFRGTGKDYAASWHADRLDWLAGYPLDKSAPAPKEEGER